MALPSKGMSLLLIGAAFVAVLPAGAVRSDGRAQGQNSHGQNSTGKAKEQNGAPDLFDDPFGDLLPPANTNPNTRGASNQVLANEERLLASESLLDEQVELREEERMEVLCAAYGLRESTGYDAEQVNEAAEERDVRTWEPTDAEHQCLPIAKQNKFMPGELIGLSGKIPVPVFPQRLGELVIEAVTHTDKRSEKHIVLEVRGCSSCENDATATVEWAGLLPLDETGKPTGIKAGASGEAQTELVEGYPLRSGFPRLFSYDQCPARKQKWVKRHTYKYSSYHFDKVVEPMAKEFVSLIPEDTVLDPPYLKEHSEQSVGLMEELKTQVKHIPFNHKLEQLHMRISVCELSGNNMRCPNGVQESLILHDGGLVVSSSETLLFDEIGKKTGQQCSYGPCFLNGQKHYMYKGNDKYDFTMCSKCGANQCPATRANPKPKTQTSAALPEENWFNCVVERFHTPSGSIDLFQQASDDTFSKTPLYGNGFLYRGTDSPGHVEGHINWHISIPPRRHCEPVLQDAVYVGMGVDEADRCGDLGGVDVDIGVILIKCQKPSGRRTDTLAGGLGGAKQGGCEYYDHLNYAKKTAKDGNKFYAISADNRGGEGEGDDEWIFLDLAGAKDKGVTHIVLMANIFGCARGQPSPALQWGELEGAFMRVAASGKTKKQFTAAETISYVDLDEMKGGADAGAAVYVLYLSDDAKLAVPPFIKDAGNRKDAASADGKAWKLLSLKQPLPGSYLGKSYEHVAALLYGNVIEKIPERGIAQQTVNMGIADTLATGQEVRGLNSNRDAILTADWTADLEDLSNEAIRTDLAVEQPSENAHEKKARTMSEADFKKHFSAFLPEGAPGTDSYCI